MTMDCSQMAFGDTIQWCTSFNEHADIRNKWIQPLVETIRESRTRQTPAAQRLILRKKDLWSQVQTGRREIRMNDIHHVFYGHIGIRKSQVAFAGQGLPGAADAGRAWKTLRPLLNKTSKRDVDANRLFPLETLAVNGQ